jgi:Icc-related predicted phosphoesterase
MLVRVTADLHGNLPEIEPCDLLLIAGDVCPDNEKAQQRYWLRILFHDWLRKLPAKEIVWIAGNHDFVCETPGFYRTADKLPGHYLRDEAITLEIDGESVRIYGMPWVPNLPSWAFYADSMAMQSAAMRIPDDIDIALLHGPPAGILDQAVRGVHVGAMHVGSRLSVVAPKLCVFGHIHEAFGTEQIGTTTFCNAAYVDENYKVRGLIPEFNL